MIVHDSFSVSEGNQGGLNAIQMMATALPSSYEEQQSNNLDEYWDRELYSWPHKPRELCKILLLSPFWTKNVAMYMSR